MKNLLAIFVLVLVILSGCGVNDPTPVAHQGSLTLNISSTGLTTKTIQPNLDMTIATYNIYGSGPNGTSFRENDISDSTVTIPNLAVGAWTITVDAKNSDGVIIGSGVTNVTVDSGKTNSVNISVTPVSGNGALRVTISWPAGIITNPSASGTLAPVNGGADNPITFNVASDQLSASYENTALAAGYYILDVQLYDGAIKKWGGVESVRIIAGQTSEGAYPLISNPGQIGDIEFIITPDLQNPITIAFSGQQTELQSGTDMTVTATPSETVDSYQWYLNGKALTGAAGQSVTIGKSLGVGTYRLDVMVKKGNIASSASLTFTVISDPIKNINTGISYPTIQSAIDAAQTINGHTIQVAAGTYQENLTINKSITLTGAGADKTIIEASNPNTHVCYITASNVNISDVTMKGAAGTDKVGIYLQSVTGVTISKATIKDNFWGICLNSSSNNNILNNSVLTNSVVGMVCFGGSNSNVIRGNIVAFTVNGNGIDTGDQSNSNTIVENNTVYSNKGTGICCYAGSNNMQIRGNTLYGNGCGIVLGWSSGCVVENNVIHDNVNGFYFDTASNNTVRNNNIYSNTNNGIGLSGLNTSGNQIYNNTIRSNQFGVSFETRATNNVIKNNLITQNSYGIKVYLSNYENYNNRIYNNNIIGNTTQAIDDSPQADYFDNGAGEGGNYWNNWTTPDANNDGYVDNPYAITGGYSQDNYPLKNMLNLTTP